VSLETSVSTACRTDWLEASKNWAPEFQVRRRKGRLNRKPADFRLYTPFGLAKETGEREQTTTEKRIYYAADANVLGAQGPIRFSVVLFHLLPLLCYFALIFLFSRQVLRLIRLASALIHTI
jgi:hypothetical protein